MQALVPLPPHVFLGGWGCLFLPFLTGHSTVHPHLFLYICIANWFSGAAAGAGRAARPLEPLTIGHLRGAAAATGAEQLCVGAAANSFGPWTIHQCKVSGICTRAT